MSEGKIVGLLSKVMEDAGVVKKGERNQHQNFSFRGIDAVTNAVSPALRKHGVIVVPHVIDYQHETVTVGSTAKSMASVRVLVRYTFHADDGSSIETVVPGESFDSGDKATAKAMSIAFRIALLQTLCLPTDDTDPDHDTYERAPSDARASHPAGQGKPVQRSKPAGKEPGASAQVVPIGGGRPATASQVEAIGKIARSMGMTADAVTTFVTATIGRSIDNPEQMTLEEASNVIKAFNEAKGDKQ
jgi:hypothetical protein